MFFYVLNIVFLLFLFVDVIVWSLSTFDIYE